MHIYHLNSRFQTSVKSVLCLLLLMVGSVHAETETNGSKEIRIGVPGYYPWGWMNSQEQIVGVVPQHFETLFAAHNEDIQLRYVLCAIDRCRHQLLKGRLDMFIDRHEPVLNERLINIGKVQTLTVERWFLKQTDADTTHSPSVAVTASTARRIKLDNEHLHLFSTPHNFIKMLIHERVNSVISFGVTLELLALNFQLSRDDFDTRTLQIEDFYFWISPLSILAEDSNKLIETVSTVFSDDSHNLHINDYVKLLTKAKASGPTD